MIGYRGTLETCREFTTRGWRGDMKRGERGQCDVLKDTHCTHAKGTNQGSICCACLRLFDLVVISDDDESGLV